jgi:hypothetical protein
MPEPHDERGVIDYASQPPPPPQKTRRPPTANEFGCALVTVLYGIPLLIVLIFVLIAFSQTD